ncbi:hypothetical protein NliqN6_3272 [Naganishia liquefaciens]|uniref:Kinesin-like protein n=1 Tax=Naganishia liquefaciens TaxID=104408 RepID=A0A8H3TTC2_9TREE|nr:hypothetical protein NliqN6_3272 [Naganishia liquefaciens]
MAFTATSSSAPATPDRMKRSSRLLGVRDPLQSSPRLHVAASHSNPKAVSSSSSDKVTVCVRFKPASSLECYEAYNFAPDGNTLTLSDSHPTVIKRNGKAGREKEYTYRFSGIYRAPDPTLSLYERQIAPLVAKAMAGFNSTIFAYGQTGSGKTHTMSGTSEDVGIIPLAVSGVFAAIEQNPGRQYLLRVSYLEIYNETLRDILQPMKGVLNDKEKPVLHVIEGNVVVRPLREEIVRTPEEVLGLLERGQKNRRTGATDWNERSSRSHCVFTITIESRLGSDIRQSRLTLIDLAGSEKAASNLERLAEGKHINRSLLALGTVIELLSDKNKRPGHIPYRNSKLTHLLENALGGNANIAVICTLSAETHHSSETLESLKFASRCAQVETQAIQGIVTASEKALLQAKEEEITKLREQIELLQSVPSSDLPFETAETVSDQKQQSLQNELADLERRRNKLVDQLRTLNSEILSSHASQSPGNPATIGKVMQRRVSDLIRMQSGKTSQPSDSASNSRRAVSGKILSINEEESDDDVLSADLLKAFKAQRSTDKRNNDMLLARLVDAEASACQTEQMRQEINELRRCLDTETAKSEELRKQLAGRELMENRQSDEVQRLKSEVSRAQAELSSLKVARPILSAPSSNSVLNAEGLPATSPTPIDDHVKLRNKAMSSVMSHPIQQHCADCQRYKEKMKAQETIIQGQQSVNQALMDRVADWQKRVLEQDDLIRRLLPRLQVQEKENVCVSGEADGIKLQRKSSDKIFEGKGRTEPRTLESPQKSRPHQSPSKASLYSGLGPRPLPMSETQESNFSPKSHRRVTIEHDINRLQSINRVDKTRSFFKDVDKLS